MTEQTAFAKGVGGHVQWKLRNRESSFICVYASPENVQNVFNEIIRVVAEAEHWPEPINYNYATFQIANQTLYLRAGIMLDVYQRMYLQEGVEDASLNLDVEKYTKLFFDLSPSAMAEDRY